MSTSAARHRSWPRYRLLPAALFTIACLAVWGLAASPATACCSAYVCDACLSSRSDCPCGPAPHNIGPPPTCNLFVCNCNLQCGEWTFRAGKCHFSSPCKSGEAKAQAQARFDEIDTNHDGKISLAEAAAWLHKRRAFWLTYIDPKSLPADLKPTKANEKALLKWAFDLADTNHDGFIEPAELDSSLGPGK